MAERAGYTVTMFVIDVSPSMAKTREVLLAPGPDGEQRTKEITNLEWALEFVLLKVQEMIFAGRKTDQCGVILFGTKKTKNCVNDSNGGYDHVTEYIPIAQPTQHTMELISAIKPSKVQGDALDGLIVAIQTQALHLGKKKTWTRKVTILTDGESPLNTEDWENTAEKLNELDVRTTIIGVDFDDDDFKEEDKSEQKAENEQFYNLMGAQIEKCLIGSCYQALEDCALPDIKIVKPAAKHIILRLGYHYPDHVEDDDDGDDGEAEKGIEISARVHKVTSKASPVSLKRFIKRGGGRDGGGGKSTQQDEDEDDVMEDAEETKPDVGAMYAPVERETRYHLRPPAPEKKEDEDVKLEDVDADAEHEVPTLGDMVEAEDLVKGYKYGATWVLIDEEFDKLPTKAGIEGGRVIGFMHASKFQRWYLMGEIYSLSADDKSIRSQIALSSFIRGMVIKDVLAIVRWVHADGADPKMAICCPIVEVERDYLFMARVPFAEDLRNYTFPSLDDLKNKKGEAATKHPFVTTDEMVTAMEKWVDKMDLMEAAEGPDGSPEPWYDMSASYNPSIHRLKTALFHGAVFPDLENNPIPPPHPELTKYLEPPSEVVERSKKALEKLKKAVDVKLVPPKVRGKKKANEVDATLHTQDDFDVADLLGDEGDAGPVVPSRSIASLSLKSPFIASQKLEAEKKKSKMDLDDQDTEDEDDQPHRAGRSHLPTPDRSPPSAPTEKKTNLTRQERDVRQGRIIGNAFPLNDFRENLKEGDVVSKALKDMAAVIPEIVDESFSTQRYDEAIQCMREMRRTALQEDDIDIWNDFLHELKEKCQRPGYKRKDFWDKVKGIGMQISLITDKEAELHEGYSAISELQSVQLVETLDFKKIADAVHTAIQTEAAPSANKPTWAAVVTVTSVAPVLSMSIYVGTYCQGFGSTKSLATDAASGQMLRLFATYGVQPTLRR
ncbi:ATP-dependent DNA helicase II subunit 2 [Tulasnella sp. 425]|nr:ATP-dependent DNA helicase II subunit 2 [Tulasnella sp. 425]